MSSAGWLTVSAGGSGSANGTVSYAASANTVQSPRTATLTVAGQAIAITQAAAAACSYSISPTSTTVDSEETTITVTVTTQPGCAWTTVQVDSWLDVQSGASGTGSGPVRIDVERYRGGANQPPRVGKMTIAGQTLTVTQTRRD